jgi:sugar/nucleoside kinase (ribokinase family)
VAERGDRTERTLSVAQAIVASLRETGTASAVIGAIALAFHGYARATQDVDLATHVDPRTVLRDIARTLQQQGYTTRLILPDVEDPLGGVLTVTGDDFDAVQVVNFYNPWAAANNPGESSIQAAAASIPGYDLPVVDVPHLVALKLYAGGPRNQSDVLELIERNRDVDRIEIRRVCEQFDLVAEIDEMLRDV